MLAILFCVCYFWAGYLWWERLYKYSDDMPERVDMIPIYMIIWPVSVTLFVIHKILKAKNKPGPE